jgi:hypothetical protein
VSFSRTDGGTVSEMAFVIVSPLEPLCSGSQVSHICLFVLCVCVGTGPLVYLCE